MIGCLAILLFLALVVTAIAMLFVNPVLSLLILILLAIIWHGLETIANKTNSRGRFD